MKSTLLLNDEPETVRPMLKEVTSGCVAVRESEARGAIAIAGAIPVRGVSSPTNPRKPTLRFHHQSNSEVNRWNI